DECLGLAEIMVEKFWDGEAGNFYDTASDHEQLLTRPRSFYDNATPSGNSVAADVLLRLALITGDPEGRFRPKAEAVLRSLAGIAVKLPSGFGRLLSALDFYLGSPKEIVIVGKEGEPETQALLDEVFG